MDENKLKKLRVIGYTVANICGLCAHANLETWGNPRWGTCKKETYDHLKHSDSKRQLSITEYGSCPSWVKDASRTPRLHGFEEFLEE